MSRRPFSMGDVIQGRYSPNGGGCPACASAPGVMAVVHEDGSREVPLCPVCGQERRVVIELPGNGRDPEGPS